MLKLGREALEDRPDLRSQWDKKSASVMFEAVSAKYGQNLELREKLKSTGIRPLGEIHSILCGRPACILKMKEPRTPADEPLIYWD